MRHLILNMNCTSDATLDHDPPRSVQDLSSIEDSASRSIGILISENNRQAQALTSYNNQMFDRQQLWITNQIILIFFSYFSFK
jgi:hypothetical protein